MASFPRDSDQVELGEVQEAAPLIDVFSQALFTFGTFFKKPFKFSFKAFGVSEGS